MSSLIIQPKSLSATKRQEPAYYVRVMWFGPEDEREEVRKALDQQWYVERIGIRLPKQLDASNQRIADNLSRKLNSEEVAAFPQEVMAYVGQFHEYAELAKNLLEALEQGGDVWDWSAHWQSPDTCRHSYSLGWCVIRDGQVVAALCHSHG